MPDETFTYDPMGNRVTSHLSASHLHDAANRLLEDDSFTYTYDANGNRLSKTDKATVQTTTYTYDIENQLIRGDLPNGQIAEYRYDGLGRRIEKSLVSGLLSPVSVTRYLYDQEDIVGIFTGPTNCQTHAVLHGPGIDQPLGFLRDTNADCTFADADGFREPIVDLLSDGLDSPVALTSETHGFFRTTFLAERYAYDSFGTPRISGPGPDGIMDTEDDVVLPCSAFGNPYLFTGREWDPETGLYYYRRRYYDPRPGRFLQEDPLGGNIALPMSFNPYPYVSNNPLRFTDPFGLGEVADRTAEELRTRLGQHLSEEQIQKMGTAVERAGVIGLKEVLVLKFGSPEDKEKALRRILEKLEQKTKKDPEQQKLLDEFKEAMRKVDPQQGAECPVP